MSTYPAGFTQGQHDRIWVSDNRMPNQETCFLCGLDIEQDDDTREWHRADLYYKPTVSDFLGSFETQEGWVCSPSCWNDRVALNADESIPAIHLVKK